MWDAAAAKDALGRVYDPHTNAELFWNQTKNRWDQWHMGHKEGKEYSKLHRDYLDDRISYDQFLREYRNPNNYHPEHPLENMGHYHEAK